jgi:hypothetical protein
MAPNPFYDELDDTFRGTRVRVHAAGHTYEGWARLWHYNQPAIVLYDATRDDGDQVGAVTIDDPEIVERLDADSQDTIEEVPVAAISDSPYSVREPTDTDHKQFVKLTRERGHLLTFPTVRPIERSDDSKAGGDTADHEYEVVIGHRRVATARKAGLDTIAARVRDLDEWEAVEFFVDDHIPIPDAGEGGLYTREEIEQAITRLRADWSDERLLELGPLAPYLRDHLASTRRGSRRQIANDGRPDN